MEIKLEQKTEFLIDSSQLCFNPCFYGNQIRTSCRYSNLQHQDTRFNPCFYGNQIRTFQMQILVHFQGKVSILVFMEIKLELNVITGRLRASNFGFNPCFYGNQIRTCDWISIKSIEVLCFNPCFYGNQIRTFSIILKLNHDYQRFQSLFLWKSN